MGPAVAALVLPALAAFAAPAQAASSAITISGTFSSNGAPIAGGKVALWAWPNGATLEALPDDADVPFVRVSTATTLSNGSYTLAPDLSLLSSSYFEPDGSVSLMEQALSGTAAQTTNFSASLPSAAAAAEGTVATVDSPASVSFDLSQGTVTNSLVDASTVSTEDVPFGTQVPSLTSAPAHVVPGIKTSSFADASAAEGTAAEATAVVDSGASVPPGLCGSWKTGAKVEANAQHFVNVYTWSSTKATVTETSSDSHELGIGVNWAEAGWGISGTDSLSTSSQNSISRPFRAPTAVSNQVNYRQIYRTCFGRKTWDLNSPIVEYKDKQAAPTGFYALEVPALDKTVSMPSWTKCTKYGADVTLSKQTGKNETFAAGVSLPFVKLSSKDTFTKEMRISWLTEAASWFCGSDAQGPSAAPRALVKKWTSSGGGCGGKGLQSDSSDVKLC